MNTVANFIPNKTVTCDDRETCWMNSFIKNLICAEDNFYQKFIRKSNIIYNLCVFKILTNHLNQFIQAANNTMLTKLLKKWYWSLLKTLLNGNKTSCIPPLFHGDKYIVDFLVDKWGFQFFFCRPTFPYFKRKRVTFWTTISDS